jgi:hypothetical protein
MVIQLWLLFLACRVVFEALSEPLHRAGIAVYDS